MRGSYRSAGFRMVVWVTALALALPLAVEAAGSLHEVWSSLVGRKGILEEKACGYDFTLSRPTQSGNAIVQSVESDHVVLLVDRDQKKVEMVIPLAQITLRRESG